MRRENITDQRMYIRESGLKMAAVLLCSKEEEEDSRYFFCSALLFCTVSLIHAQSAI